jgi:PBSX family phage terminase large subunit
MYYDFSPYLFNPLYWHLLPLLRDENIRYIYLEGGSSAAKTYTVCQALSVDMYEHEYSTMAFRRFQINIPDSVYASFKAAIKGLQMDDYYTPQQFLIKGEDDKARIRFRGLDDEENIKGIEDFQVVYNNEWSQFTEDHWSQQRKRLRGKPNQKFICDWNPISSKLWQYENWLDQDQWTDLPLHIEGKKYSQLNPEFSFKRINKKGNSVWIKVTFRDNYWIVGHPNGKYGFRDQHTLDDFEHDRLHKPNLYRVYANGERGILRTGGEFWKQFDETRHVRPLKVEKTTLHISLDENVMPYVTIGCWQYVKEKKEFRQVHEIPCKQPSNNAPKAAGELVKWLRQIDYQDVVYIYGDPSSSKRSTIDPNNSSFYDKFMEVLRAAGFQVVNRVARSAPEVALSAAFINEIYENNLYGYSIVIADHCRVSIDDYCTVKEDRDGTMLKLKVKDPVTEQSYEPNGHYSDQKRYLLIKMLEQEFNQYKSRGKKLPISVPR